MVPAARESCRRLASTGLSLRQMPEPRQIRSTSTIAMSVAMIIIGLILCIRTLAAGGGPLATGLILGVLFVVAGAGRVYLRRLTR